MTRTSRPRLRSEISRGHSPDYLPDGTSARTRPLSYDEIMRRRKTKKQVDVPKEEAQETEDTRYEERVDNPDHHSKDANAAAVKHSNNFEQEADYRTKEDKSHMTEDTLNLSKTKEVYDSQSKHKFEKDSRNGVDAVKASRRGHLSDKLDDGNQHIDSRSIYKHDREEKNGPDMAKFDKAGHVSDRNRGMGVGSMDKHESDLKKRTSLLETGRRGIVRDYLDEEKRDMGSRSKYEREKYMRTDTKLPKPIKQGHRSGRLEEERHDFNSGSKDKHEAIVRNSRSLKEDRRGSLRDRQVEESHDVSSRSKTKYDKEARNNSDGFKSNRRGHERSEHGEVVRDVATYDANDKHRRDSVAQTRYIERSRGALERERKRKDRSVGDEKYRLQDSVKRHHGGHRLDSELSERKGKTEISQLRHDETRSKRRRSRSIDKSKDRDRKSKSVSPKAQKNTLSHEHEHAHGTLPLHLPKEKSSHKSDDDRSNTAINGSNSHHRRHSGFSSGLGGYSPRKRKTDAAIRTPSPILSPERKSAGWDLPSSKVERNINTSITPGAQPLSLDISSNKIDLAIGTSVASNMGMPLSKIFLHGLSTFKEASVDSVQLTQATRPMRRLYIDNIPASASEKEIMESFNTHLLSSGSNHIRGTRPCISCMINKEKGQALLEFLTPEDASAALTFDGRSLYGSILKIRRPKDYVEMTGMYLLASFF